MEQITTKVFNTRCQDLVPTVCTACKRHLNCRSTELCEHRAFYHCTAEVMVLHSCESDWIDTLSLPNFYSRPFVRPLLVPPAVMTASTLRESAGTSCQASTNCNSPFFHIGWTIAYAAIQWPVANKFTWQPMFPRHHQPFASPINHCLQCHLTACCEQIYLATDVSLSPISQQHSFWKQYFKSWDQKPYFISSKWAPSSKIALKNISKSTGRHLLD